MQLLNGIVLLPRIFADNLTVVYLSMHLGFSWHFHWVNLELMHITYLVRADFVLLNILTKGSRLVFQVVLAKSFVYQAFVFDET